MGRFDSWAVAKKESQTLAVAVAANRFVEAYDPSWQAPSYADGRLPGEEHFAKKEAFLVDNKQLQSKSKGVSYRSSPCIQDKAKKVACFGDIVCGMVVNCEDESASMFDENAWLKVDYDLYLPFKVSGSQVLILAREDESNAEDEVHCTTSISCEKYQPPQVDPTLLDPGVGTIYNVVAEKVSFHKLPTVRSEGLGWKKYGDELELFGWDDSRNWRQFLDHRTNLVGWIMLDHPDYGPLLRPNDLPLSVKQFQPLCMAVRERNYSDMKRFIEEGDDVNILDPGGYTPLMIAAELNDINSITYLLHAGANPHVTLAAGETAQDLADQDSVRAFIQACIGEVNFNYTLYEQAYVSLNPDMCGLADELFTQGTQTAVQRNDVERQVFEEEDEIEIEYSARTKMSTQIATQMKPSLSKEAPQESLGKHEVQHGVAYMVVFEGVIVRQKPHKKAQPVITRFQDEILKLHEWDESHQYRRVGADEDGMGAGWVLIEDDDHGELLKPLGLGL